ncbi:Gfo/Idh/MocA family protein [Aestuariivivens sediminis]|uniref:Gfo/Idh/MocA family protein n=1 Tax=Aestuariivivens sediminis TaxID=2913557 RepID=UPI001F55AB20|nr:Gfo/Idh/MocA family oxidoreductase [Aestuariivivens sediminis]
MKNIDRRNFIKKTALTGAGMSLGRLFSSYSSNDVLFEPNDRYMGGFKAPKLDTVRIALIGVGARGSSHAIQLASIAGTEIIAICDLYEDLAKSSAVKCTHIGKGLRHKHIGTYYGDEDQWKVMLEETKPDAVFIATNWNNHALMAIATMKKGAHAFIEVPIAVTLEEMWEIVFASEQTQKHCMMMENVNYGREELLYLNMCRQGVIGELLHAEASYIHDLREQMYNVDRGTGSWRTYHYAKRNGNLYPTHGLGPVAQYMNLVRGEDNFSSIVSFSTLALGRKYFAEKNFPKAHKWNQINYTGGDLNTSIIKTTMGRTIMIQWDETSPRPYTRHNLIQGTKGTLAGFPTRVSLEGGVEGVTEDHHNWVQGDHLEKIYEKYEHPLYVRLGKLSEKMGGHGGKDFMMLFRIVECLRQGEPLDQNVYEGCFWSAVSPLSERSVEQGGAPQVFPDFTRGEWKRTHPLTIIK